MADASWKQLATKEYVDAQVAGIDTLSELTDTSITSIAIGEILMWDGTDWINKTLAESNLALRNGTYSSLRAQATTKADVGLGNVPNSHIQYSSAIDDATASARGLAHEPFYTAAAAWTSITGKPNVQYTSAIPADDFTSGQVTNLQANQLSNGSTPWTDGSNITSGTISSARLPALALTDVYAVANQTAQLALTVQEGDVAVRSDQNKSYIALNSDNADMSDWQELLTPTDAVLSVNGATGAVTLTHDGFSDFVQNEHRNHSEISVVAGNGLTGGGTIVQNRTINVVGGNGISVTADAISTNDAQIVHNSLSGYNSDEHINWKIDQGATVIHSSNYTNTTYSEGDGGLTEKNFTATLKTKLDGIAASANNYSHPTTAGNKHIPSGGASGQFLKYSASGTAVWAADNDTTYSIGDGGLTQKNFTTALYNKLNGIEALADVTDAANVNAAGAVMNSDTSASAMSFVLDEDNMSSNSATKLATQQSIKAYTDTKAAMATRATDPSGAPDTGVGSLSVNTADNKVFMWM